MIRLVSCILLLWPGPTVRAQSATPKAAKTRAVKPGITTPGVQRPIAAVTPDAIFPVEGSPDWLVVTSDAVWVSSARSNHVVKLDAQTNKVSAIVSIHNPCSGLASGFGSIWVPSCGDHTLVRLDAKTGAVTATIAASAADSEGGIAASDESVWLMTDVKGTLSRINPNTNKVEATIALPDGSFGATYGEGGVWITSTKNNLLTHVDPKTNKVIASIPVGPQPRFVTAGGGSAWTLNQGDGSISRVDAKSNQLLANITAGIPGEGGEIAFGEGSVWATIFQFPISRIDINSNAVVQQWSGPGGDSIRAGLGSVWLSNLKQQNVWRISLAKLK